MMIKKVLCLSSLLVVTNTAYAQDDNFALGINAGTIGFGLNGTFKVNDKFNVRAMYSSFDDTDTQIESGISYNFSYDIDFTSVLLDWHPVVDSGFRVSLGLADSGINVTGTANANGGTYTIGNTTYTSAAAGSVNASVDYDSVSPYVGIGWGNALRKDGSITFSADLGVIALDQPTVDITATGAVAAVDLSQEETELRNSLDDFELYPVVNFSLQYKF